MRLVDARDARPARGRSGGHCQVIGAGREGVRGGGGPALVYLDPGAAEPIGLVVDPPLVRGVGPGHCRHGQHPAEVVTLLPQLDAVAMLGAQRGEFRSRRAATDDQHRRRPGGTPGKVGQLRLAGEGHVDAAGIGQALDLLAVDALVEADTRAKRLGVQALGLADDGGVGHRRPSHAHQVGVAGGKDGLGLLHRGDPAGVDHGQ